MNFKKFLLVFLSFCLAVLSLTSTVTFASNADDINTVGNFLLQMSDDDEYPLDGALLKSIESDRGYLLPYIDIESMLHSLFMPIPVPQSLDEAFEEYVNFNFYEMYGCETSEELEAMLPDIILDLEHFYEIDIPDDSTLDDLIRIDIIESYSWLGLNLPDIADNKELFRLREIAISEFLYDVDLPDNILFEDIIKETYRQLLFNQFGILLPENSTSEEIYIALIIASLEAFNSIDIPDDIDTLEDALLYYFKYNTEESYGIQVPDDAELIDIFELNVLLEMCLSYGIDIPDTTDFYAIIRQLCINICEFYTQTDLSEYITDEELFDLIYELFADNQYTFDPYMFSYSLSIYGIYDGVTNITLTAFNPEDTILVNNEEVKSGVPFEVSFSEGNTKLNILVINSDGMESQYTLDIFAEKNNSTRLNNISIGGFDGLIDESTKTISVSVPFGTDLRNLSASLELPRGATATLGESVDLSSPVKFVITAEDGSTAEYTINVTVEENPDPTEQPTESPSETPTENPTDPSTQDPTIIPTSSEPTPTPTPTPINTNAPTVKPTDNNDDKTPETSDSSIINILFICAASGAYILRRKYCKA